MLDFFFKTILLNCWSCSNFSIVGQNHAREKKHKLSKFFCMERIFLAVLISQLSFNCRLLCVEHVEKNGKQLLYLVFEFLDTDLKKFIDSHRRGPSPRPIPPTVIKVFFFKVYMIFVAKFNKLGLILFFLI